MTSNNTAHGQGHLAARKQYRLIGVAVLVVAIGIAGFWFKVVRGGEDPASNQAVFLAKRGPLTISVLEAGAIKAKDPEVIRNEVEGRTSITYLIPEGTRVKKGDLLVELDVSTLTDNKIDQDIRVKNAEASYINAKETMVITESQAQSDVDLARLSLEFAKQDLEKYTGKNGQRENDLAAALGKIKLSEESLEKARETLTWSQRLYDEKYLSKTQLQADQLAMSRAEIDLQVANNDANLLQDYTFKRQVAQLTSDVNQADMALERAEAKARANIAQAKADLEAKELAFQREKDKMTKIEDQISKAKILAPTDGMVVYATSSRGGGFRNDRQPLDEGVEVFERQELIYLPRSTSSVAEVDVHEASLEKVHSGLPTVVTVDALPGKKFMGTVDRIAPLPDPQSMWMNPDLKIYKTDILLEGEEPSLRSGMSCKAEIVVEHYEDTVYVPVQSVLRVNGQPTVYVFEDGEVTPRNVKIGLDNNSMVAVLSGLNEGEAVLLAPPLKEAALQPGARLGTGDANDGMKQKITEKLKAAGEARATQTPQAPVQGQGPAGSGQGPQGGPGFRMPSAEEMQRFQKMTPEEQQKAMQDALANMTPEQRDQMEKMKQRFQNMSPEEREQMRQRRGQGGRRGGGSGAGGPGGNSGGGQQGSGPGSDRPRGEQ
jgi:HlyD family secretion protein